MTIEFRKTAKRVATEKTVMFIVCVIVAGAFGFLLFSGITDIMVVKIASIFAVLVALVLAFALLREIRQIRDNGQDWVVQITDKELIWDSPIPEQMQPFRLNLSDITQLLRTHTYHVNSNKPSKTTWEILPNSGSPLEINGQMSGINPEKVFKALEEKGITFERRSIKKGKKVKFESRTNLK